ncbi:MAG: winged helix-turn-helix transcriptional regulator [Bacillati bacterium ANGP1]|uniref:Winged helix-turn-helix transcriptional regulator n=1 Tax=Candidatus Segetimicrobium genomatis TaxID=2569760 RepID=A0A537JES3_9BACT|nr:MAG: winged helix-turn-helix transcriptional regulator [Terrabacteria group bacterium ANGP1]
MVDRHPDPLGRVFVAVADPTRRSILNALRRRPATITEIARPFPVSLNAISKHVKILERAGLVHRAVVGREHYCRFDARPLRRATAWLERYREFWESRLDALERHLLVRRRRPK